MAAAATARSNFESRMKIAASLPSLTHDTVEDFIRRIDSLYAAINHAAVEDAAHIETLLQVIATKEDSQPAFVQRLIPYNYTWPELRAHLQNIIVDSGNHDAYELEELQQGQLAFDVYQDTFLSLVRRVTGLSPDDICENPDQQLPQSDRDFRRVLFRMLCAKFENGLRDTRVKNFARALTYDRWVIINQGRTARNAAIAAAAAAAQQDDAGADQQAPAAAGNVVALPAFSLIEFATEVRRHISHELGLPPSLGIQKYIPYKERRVAQQNESIAREQQQQRHGSRNARGPLHNDEPNDQRAQREPIVCYYCNRRGHVISECRTKVNDERAGRAPRNRRGNDNTNPSVNAINDASSSSVNAINDANPPSDNQPEPRPRGLGFHANINDQECSVLLDTGAEIDCISPDFVRTLQCPILTGPTIKVESSSGNLTTSSSYVEVDLSANEYTGPVRFLVVRCPRHYDAVLSMKWIKGRAVTADFITDTVHCAGRLVFTKSDRVMPSGTVPALLSSIVVQQDVYNSLTAPAPEQDVLLSLPDATKTTPPIEARPLRPTSTAIMPLAKLPEGNVLPLYSINVDNVQDLRDAFHVRFSDIFSDSLDQLPPHRDGFDFHINLDEPSALKPRLPYSMSDQMKAAMQNVLAPLLDNGIVERTTDPAFCPSFMVPKSDGPNGEKRYRMVVDARPLNINTTPIQARPQLVDDEIHRVGNASVFSRIDFTDAFFQLRATKETAVLQTVATPLGNFRFNVMIQGARNSSVFLMRFFEDIFHPLVASGCISIYADDVLIFTDTVAEHTDALHQFFEICHNNDLRVSFSKSELYVTETTFLGYSLGHGTIDPIQRRIAALIDYPEPSDRHQLRRFLGAINFYRHHFPGLAIDAAPLNALTTDTKPWTWTQEQSAAFQRVKALLADPRTLGQPNNDLPFDIYTDASVQGFGGVVAQSGKPLAFVSKGCSGAQSRWPTSELELYAVRYTLDQFKHWIAGADVNVYCDHKTLSYLSTVCANKRLLRHYADISEYGVAFHYIPGCDNGLADFLSRDPRFTPPDVDGSDLNRFFDSVVTKGSARSAPCLDDELKGEDQDDATIVALSSMLVSELRPAQELMDLIANGYDTDSFTKTLLAHLRGNTDDPSIATVAAEYYLHDSLIWKHGQHDTPDRIVVAPQSDAMREILVLYHDENTHLGGTRLSSLLQTRFYIPKLDKLVRHYVSTCPTCQTNKISNKPPAGAAQPHAVPRRAWQDISIDFLTGLPARGRDKFDAILVVVDKFTKRVVFIPCTKTTTAEETAELLLVHIAQHYGAFESISSDRGPQFTANVFQTIWDRLGVRQSLATANHASSTGQAERYVRAVIEALRVSLFSSSEEWHHLLPFIAMSLNAAPHSTHGQPPFTVDTGRSTGSFYDLVLPRPVTIEDSDVDLRDTLQQLVRDTLSHARYLRSKYMNRKRRTKVVFRVGDKVLVSRSALVSPEERERHWPKLRSLRSGPFTIVAMNGTNAAKLNLPSTLRAHPVINVSHLVHYNEDKELHPTSAEDEPPLFRSNEGDFFVVESIIGHKVVNGKYLFTVKWKGYDSSHNSEIAMNDFASGHHIHDYCRAVGMPVPPGAPPAAL